MNTVPIETKPLALESYRSCESANINFYIKRQGETYNSDDRSNLYKFIFVYKILYW